MFYTPGSLIVEGSKLLKAGEVKNSFNLIVEGALVKVGVICCLLVWI